MAKINRVKKELSDRFEVRYLGETKICLSLEIYQNSDMKCLTIRQTNYALKMLSRFGMFDKNPVLTPFERLSTEDDIFSEPVDSSLYRQATGSLIYHMTSTRPDPAFAIEKLSQNIEHTTITLWNMFKRAIRYVRGKMPLGSVFEESSNLGACHIGYCDADVNGCPLLTGC